MDQEPKTTERPHFNLPVIREVSDFSGERKYQIVSTEDFSSWTQEDFAKFAEIANEDLVRQVIFPNVPKDQKYSEHAARDFLKWGEEGWKKGEWFLFLIRNQEEKLAGTMTIKSNGLDGAEIGF